LKEAQVSVAYDEDALATSETSPVRDLSIPDGSASELSVIAAQLTEAACRARHGDRDATRAHIAHAIALLGEMPYRGQRAGLVLPRAGTRVVRGGLPTWQAHRVVSHVDANLSRRIRVQELARLLGLSASHFCRAFKCTFGVSPRHYVLCRRIEVAQGLMLSTAEPLSSIAIRCGMCDQPHFTRSFHRIVGETPYMWRRTRRLSPGLG
jgi:AraC family transcriptional regulator